MTLPGLALGLVFSLLVPVNDLASQFLPGMVNLPFSGDISAAAAVAARFPAGRGRGRVVHLRSGRRFICAGAARKAWASATSS